MSDADFAELQDARRTIQRLNRRCQEAESALAELRKPHDVNADVTAVVQARGRRPMGRMLANFQATRYREALEAIARGPGACEDVTACVRIAVAALAEAPTTPLAPILKRPTSGDDPPGPAKETK